MAREDGPCTKTDGCVYYDKHEGDCYTAVHGHINDDGAGWWFCSFADGEKFLGAVLVYGLGDKIMIQTLASVKLNPGGEIMMIPAPTPPPEKLRGRILTKAEIEAWDATEAGAQ